MACSLLQRLPSLVCISAAAVVFWLILGADAAGAAPVNWGPGVVIVPPADAAVNPQMQVGATSCPQAGNCTAVGSYVNTSGQTEGFGASELNGVWSDATRLKLPSTANPNDPQVTMTALSCQSFQSCTAVGSYQDVHTAHEGFVITESGGNWVFASEVIHPANVTVNFEPQIQLPSISCPQVGDCVTVGTYHDNTTLPEGLIETQVNGKWEIASEQAPLPADAAVEPQVQLNSVACPTTTECAIVGSYLNTGGDKQALLLDGTLSGGTWTFTPATASLPADVSTHPGASLTAVSCPASGECEAVGQYNNNAASEQGLLLKETGGSWGTGTEAELPGDAGAKPNVSLAALSCSSVGNCGAVGGYRTASDQLQGLMLTESGGSWSQGFEPTLPADAGSMVNVTLGSVSCFTAGCVAGGSYLDEAFVSRPLLLMENPDGTWTAGLEPSLPYPRAAGPGAAGELVACSPDGANCIGMASYTDDADEPDQTGNQIAAVVSGKPTPAGVSSLSLGAPPARIELGASIDASALPATLSTAFGHNEEGTIRFEVFGPMASPPTSCASGGTLVGTAAVSGDGVYLPAAGFTPSKPGNYWWYASYGGSLFYSPSDAGCGSALPETVVQAPALGIGAPASLPLSADTISPSSLGVTLSGATGDATGTISLRVFGPASAPPSDCGSGGTTIGMMTVHGDGEYNPGAGFVPPGAGDYWWYATYTGDGSNRAANSGCGAGMAETAVNAPAPAAASAPPATATPVSNPASTKPAAVRKKQATPARPAAIRNALTAALRQMSGKSASIGAIYKAGGVKLKFAAPSAGKLVLDWYMQVKAGSGARAKPSRKLIAAAAVTFKRKQAAKVKVKLNGAGKRACRTARTLKISELAAFTPVGGKRMAVTRVLKLKR